MLLLCIRAELTHVLRTDFIWRRLTWTTSEFYTRDLEISRLQEYESEVHRQCTLGGFVIQAVSELFFRVDFSSRVIYAWFVLEKIWMFWGIFWVIPLSANFVILLPRIRTESLRLTQQLNPGRFGASGVLRKPEFSIHIINYICMYKTVQLKSKLQYTETSSAVVWMTRRLC
jgi:hypothetical protein